MGQKQKELSPLSPSLALRQEMLEIILDVTNNDINEKFWDSTWMEVNAI